MRIIDHAPRYRADRKRINLAWIAERLVVEDVDPEVPDQKEESICERAATSSCHGRRWDRWHPRHAVNATVVYQVVRMAADKHWRGRGIGRSLGEALIAKAHQHGARKMMLYFNRAGAVEAIAPYHDLCCKELPFPTKAYARADIYMALALACGIAFCRSACTSLAFSFPRPIEAIAPELNFK